MIDDEEELPENSVISEVNRAKWDKIHFYPSSDTQIDRVEGEVIDVFRSIKSEQGQTSIRDFVRRGILNSTDNVVILSTPPINYARDGVKTFRAMFCSLQIIHMLPGVNNKNPEQDNKRRYFLLGQEYTQKAFYEIIKSKIELKDFTAQFMAYELPHDEKIKLSEQIKQNGVNAKITELKI